MKLKVTILFKDDIDNPAEFKCYRVMNNGSYLRLEMADMMYRYAMNEIVNFKVEPLEEK